MAAPKNPKGARKTMSRIPATWPSTWQQRTWGKAHTTNRLRSPTAQSFQVSYKPADNTNPCAQTFNSKSQHVKRIVRSKEVRFLSPQIANIILHVNAFKLHVTDIGLPIAGHSIDLSGMDFIKFQDGKKTCSFTTSDEENIEV
jgi:hypothetical protein